MDDYISLHIITLRHVSPGPRLYCRLEVDLVEARILRGDPIVEEDGLVSEGPGSGGSPVPRPGGPCPGPQLAPSRAPGGVGVGGDEAPVQVAWLARPS